VVRVRVDLDGDGCLRDLQAVGHAGSGKPGEDLTCAAVSGLLRSVARLLHGTEGLVVAGQAPGPGRLELEVVRISPERKDWLRGVTEVLLTGLFDFREEQAGSIELKIGEKGKEEH
jgi:uncharacterized protein YsxB (DUF464 family)